MLLRKEKDEAKMGNNANLGMFQTLQARRFNGLSKETKAEFAEHAKTLNEEQACKRQRHRSVSIFFKLSHVGFDLTFLKESV